MQKITIIIGLPGSGKTSYIKEHMAGQAVIFDDYHNKAKKVSHKKYPRLGKSKHFDAFIDAMLSGKNIVITDITYCRKEHLKELLTDIKNALLNNNINAKITCIYFENNPKACQKNIFRRGREQKIMKHALNFVQKVSPKYHTPEDAYVIPVYEKQ